jgi:hypothetical protein
MISFFLSFSFLIFFFIYIYILFFFLFFHQELNIGANYLKHLIPEIGALKNLTHLELNDNILEDIPTEISHITYLQVLNLEGLFFVLISLY